MGNKCNTKRSQYNIANVILEIEMLHLYMSDWIGTLDGFLKLSKKVLTVHYHAMMV